MHPGQYLNNIVISLQQSIHEDLTILLFCDWFINISPIWKTRKQATFLYISKILIYAQMDDIILLDVQIMYPVIAIIVVFLNIS